MGDIQWIKLSTDIFNNRKIRQIQNLPQGDTLLVIWLKLMVLAGQINDGGQVYITPDIGYTPESLAAELQREATVVKLAVDCFRKFAMIQVDDRGVIRLTGWEKYQNVESMEKLREQNRLRKQRQRQRAKLAAQCDGPVTVTAGHAPEEELEAREEPEEEFHSLIQAGAGEEEGVSSARVPLYGALGQGVVFLSDAQMEDLLDKLSLEEFDYYVSVVAASELAGKHYKKKTHYQAILDMAAKDRRLST